MEISMYPVTLRLIQKIIIERGYGDFMYPVTLRLIQKYFYVKGP